MIDKDDVIACLQDAGTQGLTHGQVADALGVKKRERAGLDKMLRQLVSKGAVREIRRGRYIVVERTEASGTLICSQFGHGFVSVGPDVRVYIPENKLGDAIDGDTVTIRYWPSPKGWDGSVQKVEERGRKQLTGVLTESGYRGSYVESDDPRIAFHYPRIRVTKGAAEQYVGQCVVISVTNYPSGQKRRITGTVSSALGKPEEPETEIQKILLNSKIPTDFPKKVMAEAEKAPQEVREEDLVDRTDLRDKEFLTIDPETARDFDDALCYEETSDGHRVWVAVADVSHYLEPDSAMDREAVGRAVSVYLPDRVIPMLPFALSSGICSLSPDVDRLAMVVRIDFTHKGVPVAVEPCAAVIRSKKRLTYEQVAEELENPGYLPDHGPVLRKLDKIARSLRTARFADGALGLDLPESKVVLDEDDPQVIRDIVQSRRSPLVKRAYELIEEFMICANICVGEFLRKRVANVVWRIHEPPAPEKLEEARPVMESFGVALDTELATTSKGMQRVLDQVARTDARAALSMLVLRTLKQARYSIEPLGHFGLAATDYLHFTSPIRRYPDVLVHRLLKRALKRDGLPAGQPRFAQPTKEQLIEGSQKASELERRAMDVERETVALYKTLFMRQHVGKSFFATVTGVTDFGVFVELDNPSVDGLIRFPDLNAGYVTYDPVTRSLSMDNGVIRLGDRMMVKLVTVSVAMRRLDFRRVAEDGELSKPPPARRRRQTANKDKAKRLARAAKKSRQQHKPASKSKSKTSGKGGSSKNAGARGNKAKSSKGRRSKKGKRGD